MEPVSCSRKCRYNPGMRKTAVYPLAVILLITPTFVGAAASPALTSTLPSPSRSVAPQDSLGASVDALLSGVNKAGEPGAALLVIKDGKVHHTSSIVFPTTNATKLMKLVGNDMKNLSRKEWESFYNYSRPHGALGGQTSYKRFREKIGSPCKQ